MAIASIRRLVAIGLRMNVSEKLTLLLRRWLHLASQYHC